MQNSKLDRPISFPPILRPPLLIAIIVSLSVISASVYTVIKVQETVNKNGTDQTAVIPELKTVTALGRIEPKGKVIKLSAPVSAGGSRVQELLVKEGDKVKTGQVVAILDSRDALAAAVKEAQEQIKVEEANFQRIKAGARRGELLAQEATIARLEAERHSDITAQASIVASFEGELQNVEVENQRYELLYQQGAISASEKDSKALTLLFARKNLLSAQTYLQRIQLTSEEKIKEAKAKLNQIAEVPQVDIVAAQAQLNRSLAALETAKIRLQQAYVRSPQDGQIFNIHSRPGELISDEGILDIGQTNKMYAVAEIYESDIDKVSPGQKVQVFGDFLPIQLEGIVERKGLQVRRQNLINTDPISNIDNRVVEVYILLEDTATQAAALTNMQVKVVIQL